MQPVLQRFVLALSSLVLFFFLCSPSSIASAQGTAFLYQGRLNDGGSPANGSYNLTFTLFVTNSGGVAVAGPLTNSAIVVSNGEFSVTLDFGSGVFGGENYWLEIAVETNGTHGFTTLAPRQEMLPVPYSIMAGSASNLLGTLPAGQVTGALPASQLQGTVSLAQLPSSVLTNGATGVNLSGTFIGDVSGLTNVLPAVLWQTTSGIGQMAAANTVYFLTNNALDTLVLPYSPNVGDILTVVGVGSNGWQIVPQPGQTIIGEIVAPAGVSWTQQFGQPYESYWEAVASSADGSHLVAVAMDQTGSGQGGGIYTSTNFGTNWTEQLGYTTSPGWYAVASSADGSHLAALSVNGGTYTSIDFGNTWTQRTNAPPASGSAFPGAGSPIVMSADGSRLVEVWQHIYTSSDFGVTWVQHDTPLGANVYPAVASSADGSHLVVEALDTEELGIYTSANFGTNWTYTTFLEQAYCLASSSNGNNLAAAVNTGATGGALYTSGNSGLNWTQVSDVPSTNWYALAMSGDGTRVVAVGASGLYTSTNSGSTWQQQGAAPPAASVASSLDGNHLAAVASGSGIYSSVPTLLPFTGIAGETARFQYLGNGIWQPWLQFPAPSTGNYLHSFCTVTQAVVTVNIFQTITNTVDAQIAGWTRAPGSGSYTNAQAGLYLIQYTAEVITTATTATTVSIQAAVNGAEIPGSKFTVVANTANQALPVSTSFIASFNAGDVLQFEFAGNNKDDRLVSNFGIGNDCPSFSCTIIRIQ